MSCNNTSKDTSSANLNCYPLKQTETINDLSPYIDSLQIIPLEATDDSFITHIEKVLLTPNKDIVILNSTGILKFDKNGIFKLRIGKIGRAPGEYQKIYDICIDDKGEILSAVDHNNDVLQYSVNDGHFIQKITPKFPEKYPNCIGIVPSKNGGFFLFGCNPFSEVNFKKDFYCLNLFDKKGNFEDKFLQRKDYVFPIHIITQSYNNSYLIRPQTWDNICYRIQNNELHKHIKIDFEKEGIPCNYIRTSIGESYDIKKFLFSAYYKIPIYLQETKNHIYFSCAGPIEAENYFFLLNKNKFKGINWRIPGKSNSNLTLGLVSDETYIYYIFHDFNEYDISNLPTDMDPFKKYLISKGVRLEGENSNPLIIKIKYNI